MKGGFKEQFLSAVSAAAQSAVSAGKAAAKFAQQEALGAQCLLDYSVGPQAATAGSGHALWRIFTARSKKEGSPHPVVSAWVLDKRELTQSEEQLYGGGGGGGAAGLTRPSQRRLEAFVEQCRHDVHALARLKHPCVLRLVAPLEETRTQLVFITEPVFASLEDLLGGYPGGPGGLPPALAQQRRELRLSELEVKHGLLQVADGLHFLHSEAGLAHKAIAPASVVITTAGAWKLAGFGFSAPLDYSAAGAHKPFDYSGRDAAPLQLASQPPLPYVAPELVAGGGTGVTGAADVFSLGAVAFELLTRRQLLPVGRSLGEYEARVASLTLVDMSGVPMGLEQMLRGMVAPVAGARPPAAALAGCQWFQSDVALRALKFLDTLLQRDPVQKAAFLRDLPAMCAQFDGRVLRLLVLPPLLAELRDASLQPTLLPIVLTIVRGQEPAEFADVTLPALRPLLATASGETLLLLVQHAELLASCMPPPAAAQVLPALLVRAAEHGDTRAQEEMLRKVAALADSLDYEALKRAVLPAVHALCLATTSAAVRVGAFAAMSRLAQRMDAAEAEAMLATAVKVTAVDKSAPTVMCVLALGAALGRQHGARLCAERVLPALVPLLVAPSLNAQQFGTAMKTVRDALAAVEKGRAGGAVGDGAAPAPAGAPGARPVAPPPPAPVDWMAATDLSTGSPTASAARPAAAGRPMAAAAANGGDPLAGLQLQQPAARPAMPAAPGLGGGGGFGTNGGRVGSGKPLGGIGGIGAAATRPAAAPTPQPAQQSWAAFGGGAAAAGTRAAAASLADPFAGLQLGGASAAPVGGSRAAWGAPAFDPFAPGGPAAQQSPPAAARQQPPQQQLAAAGGWQGSSLI